jgi:DNA polymerase-3 subunit gamma/tau
MSYQVLARKWRPRSFDTLVGQEHVVRALTHALAQGRLHHAYLFTGTRGVGKTTIARILAKALNCETGITPSPCGKCSACVEIDAGRFIDLLEVDAATNTRVDEMRQLLENAVYTPTRGRFKVYVIDEVHMLSASAFNAMLKTLEEPPDHVKFILATTDPQKIPVTVLSRCLQFNLKQMPPAAITSHLAGILQAEDVAAEEPALALLAQAARGSMRDALSLLDQAIAFGGGTLSEASVRAMLGTIDRTYLFELLECIAGGDAARILAIAESMESRSVSFDSALEELARILHRIALAQTVSGGLPPHTQDRERTEALAARLDAETVQLYYQIAILGRRDLPLAPDEYSGFTMALLRMHAFLPDTHAASTDTGAVQAPRRSSAKPASGTAAVVTSRPAAVVTSGTAPAVEEGPELAAAGGGRPASLTPQTWTEAVRALRVSGFAKQLAERAELARAEGNRLVIRLSPGARQLADYRDKLRAALEEQWREKLTLEVEIAEPGGPTVAGEDARRQESALAAARATIEGDPFVNDLISGFGATIESVQPRID